MRGLALCVLAGCFGGGHPGDGVHPHGDAGVTGDGAIATTDGPDPADAAICVPRSCAQPVLACGDIDDGCGGTLACGTCPDALACGAVKPGVCGVAEADRACTNGWCWQSPLPFGNDLKSAWTASPTDGWAVGEGGTILRSAGGAWHPLDSGTSEYIDAVWGASASDVWLGGGLYARHWNGSALATPTSGPGLNGGIRGISGTSSSDVAMAGSDGLYHWNGSAWSSLGDPWGFDEVCAVTPTLAFAVGFFNADRWNGSAWAPLSDAGAPSDAEHCYGSSASDVWIASTKLVHYDGATWSTNPAWPGVGAIAGTGPHDIWATTSTGLVHWDGTAWSAPQPTDPIAGLANGIAVGPGGRIYRLDGGTWTQETGFGPSYTLAGLCAFPDDTALAIGSGVLRYRDGVVEDLGASGIYDVYSTWCASATDAWAVADFTLKHFDGAHWTAAPRVGAEPRAVWGTSATDVWAVTDATDTFNGGPALVLHYDGATWSIATTISITDNSFSLGLAAIGGGGPHDVWAVGEMGVASHFDGTAWTRFDVPDDATLTSISVAPDGTPFVVGSGGVWTRRAGAWVSIGGGAQSLVARAANDVWGGDEHGDVWHYDGATWTHIRTGAGQALLAPAFGTASAFIAGTTGGILRRAL